MQKTYPKSWFFSFWESKKDPPWWLKSQREPLLGTLFSYFSALGAFSLILAGQDTPLGPIFIHFKTIWDAFFASASRRTLL